jgi:hypothetical protein
MLQQQSELFDLERMDILRVNATRVMHGRGEGPRAGNISALAREIQPVYNRQCHRDFSEIPIIYETLESQATLFAFICPQAHKVRIMAQTATFW